MPLSAGHGTQQSRGGMSEVHLADDSRLRRTLSTKSDAHDPAVMELKPVDAPRYGTVASQRQSSKRFWDLARTPQALSE